jgi:acyl-CoA synthetase (AMP-forming)/AMP-acid ligase II
LGDKDAEEPGVKGDSLYKKLDVITTSLINLVTILEVQQVWAGGIPSPDGGENLVAAVTKKQLTDVKNTLNDILSKVVKIA